MVWCGCRPTRSSAQTASFREVARHLPSSEKAHFTKKCTLAAYVYVEKATPPEKLTVEVADGNVNKSKSGVNFFTAGCKEKTFRLKAVPEPAGSSAKVKWTSNKAGFAIDEDGVVTPPEDLKNAEYVTFTASSVQDRKRHV